MLFLLFIRFRNINNLICDIFYAILSFFSSRSRPGMVEISSTEYARLLRNEIQLLKYKDMYQRKTKYIPISDVQIKLHLVKFLKLMILKCQRRPM